MLLRVYAPIAASSLQREEGKKGKTRSGILQLAQQGCDSKDSMHFKYSYKEVTKRSLLVSVHVGRVCCLLSAYFSFSGKLAQAFNPVLYVLPAPWARLLLLSEFLLQLFA